MQLEQRPGRWWHGGDPFATAFDNAPSATVPKGEAFFVESVRQFRDGATAKLAEAQGATVAGFGFIIELTFLEPRKKLAGYDVEALIQY